MQISTLSGHYPSQTQNTRTRDVNPRSVEGLSGPQQGDGYSARGSVRPEQVANTGLPVAAYQRAAKIGTLESSVVDVVRTRSNTIDPSLPLGARRALAEYGEVESQEQRSEYNEIFGVSVYA